MASMVSFPILFLFNKKNVSELGGVLLQDQIPICIEVYLDFIAIAYDNDDENLALAVAETIEHEFWHVLLTYQYVPSVYHHFIIRKLNQHYLERLKFNTDCYRRLQERNREIESDISVMFA